MRDLAAERLGAEALLSHGLCVRDLRLSVGAGVSVDVPDLRLDPGSLTVIMGPNGAGKSLLLRLLHGLIAPDRGEVRWAGAPMSDALRRRQAMVFQKPVLLRRSVAANMDFALRRRGPDTAARRTALLERVGLAGRERSPARRLSGGEAQRLALARALATEPEVLFLDEPTASLDPASARMIEEILRDAQARGTKVVCVTHDVAQARRLADDVVFLARGRVVETGPATRLAAPQSRSLRDYLDGRLLV